jgi:hypothetical protein
MLVGHSEYVLTVVLNNWDVQDILQVTLYPDVLVRLLRHYYDVTVLRGVDDVYSAHGFRAHDEVALGFARSL